MIEEVLDIHRPNIEAKQLRISTLWNDVDRNVQFVSDRMKVAQILMNIIGNSIKFSKPAGAIRIILREHLKDMNFDQVFFRIEDDGYGIERKLKENLFKLFYAHDYQLDSLKYGKQKKRIKEGAKL